MKGRKNYLVVSPQGRYNTYNKECLIMSEMRNRIRGGEIIMAEEKRDKEQSKAERILTPEKRRK